MLYFAASFATARWSAPARVSAASYQRLSCPGAEVGPLKISCRQSSWTPFFSCFFDQRDVLLHHRINDLGDGAFAFRFREAHLDKA
jgi:hypothetical protein